MAAHDLAGHRPPLSVSVNTADGWYPAIESSGATREGAWVAETHPTGDLLKWPTGSRLTL